MSAWFVDARVIDVTVMAIIAHEKKPTDPTALGRKLWAMNAESLRQRYELDGSDELRDYLASANEYEFQQPPKRCTGYAFKQVACFTYQSCEGNVRETWSLYARAAAAEDWLKAQLGGEAAYDHPGFKDAPWGDVRAA